LVFLDLSPLPHLERCRSLYDEQMKKGKTFLIFGRARPSGGCGGGRRQTSSKLAVLAILTTVLNFVSPHVDSQHVAHRRKA